MSRSTRPPSTRQERQSVRTGWSRGSGGRRRPGREGNLRKRQHYGGRGVARPVGTAAALLPDGRDDCACGSGLAYRHCCRKARTFRQRVLRELLDSCCRPLDGGRVSLEALGLRCAEALQERGLRLELTPWLAADLATLGQRVVGAELQDLTLRARPTTDPLPQPLHAQGPHAAPTAAGLALRARILAAPGDEALRAVYGDWLAERGDPLGELIAVQVARARRRGDEALAARESALLASHEPDALGPLAPVVALGGARFSRGFAVALRLSSACGADALSALCDDPSWSTVRELELSADHRHPKLLARLLTRPALVGLRVLDGAWPGLCAALHEARLGVRELTLRESALTDELDLTAFPALQHLRLPLHWGQRPSAQLWQRPGLEQLSFHGHAAYVLWQLAPWVTRLGAEPAALRHVSFGRHPADRSTTGPLARLRRGSDGGLSSLSIDWQSHVRAGQLGQLLQALAALPVAVLTRLRISAPEGELTAHARRRLQVVARRFVRLEAFELC